jgi:tetratricopeptide (TPR) repeat protein
MRREGARRVLGFVFGLWAFGVGTATVAVAQQSWDFYYGLGLKQLRNGDPRGAIESLMNALQKGPPPGPRRLAPSGQLINFFPYLYLAKAYLALKDCERARQMLETSVQMNEVPTDHPEYDLQFVPTRQSIQKACGRPEPESPKEPPPEPSPGPTPPPATASPPIEPSPAVRPAVPVEVLRQAVRLYRRGAYRDVVRLLAESQRTYELDDGAYFLLGCSLTAQYFWEGRRDRRLLREAQAYFQRVQTLPPGLQAIVPDLVSPKVREVYGAVRRTAGGE